MSANKRLEKSLQDLILSGRCQTETVESYSKKLRLLTQEAIDEEKLKDQSVMFKALGDQTRLSIINLLRIRELCVCEIMAALGLTQPTTSHHLMILKNAGVVDDRKEGKWVFYRLVDPALFQKLHKMNVL
jgi:ArsR family transcriptional regulator